MNHYSQSIYLQLSDSIKQKIISGIYRPGDKIPSEREMSLAYGITRVTVRTALLQLQKEGILGSEQGRGTFVLRCPEDNRKIVHLGTGSASRLSVDIHSGGMTPSRVVISSKKVPTQGEVASYFHGMEYCIELVRLMLIDDTPYAVQIAYIPHKYFGDALRYDFKSCSLYEYMESKDRRPKRINSELKVEPLPAAYAKYLQCPAEKNVFSFKYFGYDKTGTLVEFTRSYNLPEYTASHLIVKQP